MSTETPTETEPTPETEAGQEGARPDEPLGEGGLKALNAERERANAAEKAAKEALAKVQEYEDRDKSEAQRQQEALEKAQKELAELTVAKTRAEVAAVKGVPVGLLNGSTQEELEASADALIAFKGEQPKPSAAPLVENTNKADVETDFGAAIAAAMAKRDFALVATLKQQQAAQSKKGN